jgi:hypothetical protein
LQNLALAGFSCPHDGQFIGFLPILARHTGRPFLRSVVVTEAGRDENIAGCTGSTNPAAQDGCSKTIPAVVFTTAFDQYAVTASELEAVARPCR